MSSDRQEDAEKALNVARQRLQDGKFDVARRLANKSKSMFPTAAADTLLAEIERKEVSGSGASAGAGSSNAKASGAEAHPSASGTHQRPGHHTNSSGTAGSSTTSSTSKVRDFTPEQHAVVKRVRACKVTEYYAILAREFESVLYSILRTDSMSELTTNSNDKSPSTDISSQQLALALHPDKNGAPGADEAFKMVSKAFQVLSDDNMRAAYDSNPTHDPESRFGGGGGGGPSMARGFGGGGMRQGFAAEQDITPEDLFNMFFGGGGGGGFGGGGFGGPGKFRYSPSPPYTSERVTSGLGIPYFVDKAEWERSPIYESIPENLRGEPKAGRQSSKLRQFENGVEQYYVRTLQTQVSL
ncbi:hypothetical protein QFC19_001834 [Naganishia cerealis]|uniref:Uncharacterized protein n=1 Tax=Naganishia cerealis TaxID=610337 RepID=A0ACC2WDM5_9TREE|nr:hypothetical protein QFC19_001834 [Naganishia cerealis]